MTNNKKNRRGGKRRNAKIVTLSGHDMPVRYVGKTLLTLTRAANQSAAYRFPLNPSYFTGAQAIATQFQEFRCVKLVAKLHSNLNLNYVFSYYKVNPVSPPDTFTRAYAAEISRAMFINDTTPQSMVLNRGDVLNTIRPWFVCSNASSAGNSEVDDYSQGAFFVFNDAALAATNINIELAFEFEFRGPTVNGIAATPKSGQDVVISTKCDATILAFRRLPPRLFFLLLVILNLCILRVTITQTN